MMVMGVGRFNKARRAVLRRNIDSYFCSLLDKNEKAQERGGTNRTIDDAECVSFQNLSN